MLVFNIYALVYLRAIAINLCNLVEILTPKVLHTPILSTTYTNTYTMTKNSPQCSQWCGAWQPTSIFTSLRISWSVQDGYSKTFLVVTQETRESRDKPVILWLIFCISPIVKTKFRKRMRMTQFSISLVISLSIGYVIIIHFSKIVPLSIVKIE